MTKQPYNVVNPPTGQANQREEGGGKQEPLSGSKTVKNRQHSRNNQAEGS